MSRTVRGSRDVMRKHGGAHVTWTTGGLVLMLSGAGITIAGLWRVDGAMATLGIAVLLLCLFSRVVGEQNVKALELSADFPRRAMVGKPFQVQLTIVNRKALFDSFQIHFGMSFSGASGVGGKVSWLGKGNRASVRQRVSVPQRGFAYKHQASLWSEFPFRLFRFERKLFLDGELGVRPQSIIPRWFQPTGPLRGERSGVPGLDFSEMDSWRGCREMRGGDSIRRVVWSQSLRALANGRQMLVRQSEPPRNQAKFCVIVFHSCGGDKKLIRPERFENAIALYQGVIERFWRDGVSVRCMADFDDWRMRSLRNSADLARVKEDLITAKRADGTEIHDLEGRIRKIEDGGSMVLVTDVATDRVLNLSSEKRIGLSTFDITHFDFKKKIVLNKQRG